MTSASPKMGKLGILLIFIVTFLAIFPPHVAEKLYVSPKDMDPTTGFTYVFGGFHFWGYQSERLTDREPSSTTGWGSHTSNHHVAWIPLTLVEAVALAALFSHFRSQNRRLRSNN